MKIKFLHASGSNDWMVFIYIYKYIPLPFFHLLLRLHSSIIRFRIDCFRKRLEANLYRVKGYIVITLLFSSFYYYYCFVLQQQHVGWIINWIGHKNADITTTNEFHFNSLSITHKQTNVDRLNWNETSYLVDWLIKTITLSTCLNVYCGIYKWCCTMRERKERKER